MVVETTQIVPLQTVEGGTIRVSGTRINLESVLWKYIDGFTPEQIRECYPDLDLADIYAVISYYLSHREEVDRYLANQEAKADEVRQRIQSEAGYREWVADFKTMVVMCLSLTLITGKRLRVREADLTSKLNGKEKFP